MKFLMRTARRVWGTLWGNRKDIEAVGQQRRDEILDQHAKEMRARQAHIDALKRREDEARRSLDSVKAQVELIRRSRGKRLA